MADIQNSHSYFILKASAIKCYEGGTEERINKKMSNDNKKVSYTLVDCSDKPGFDSFDSCIKINSDLGDEKLCGSIAKINAMIAEFQPEFQLTQDTCLKVSDEINAKARKAKGIHYRVNYVCACSTDGCNGGTRSENKILPLQ